MRPMLPSWIRSRNCRPRLVYFFAMEITRRRLASTISFFARRALASPIETSRLISLISMMVRRCATSRSASFFWRLSISSVKRASVDDLVGIVALGLVALLLGGRGFDLFDLGGILRLCNYIGRIGIDEANDAIDQTALACLHVLVRGQQMLDGGGIQRQCATHSF